MPWFAGQAGQAAESSGPSHSPGTAGFREMKILGRSGGREGPVARGTVEAGVRMIDFQGPGMSRLQVANARAGVGSPVILSPHPSLFLFLHPCILPFNTYRLGPLTLVPSWGLWFSWG